ncbi:4'-phosphopantetheinyl transferase superfamily protein, partial [Escherichia coli]|uniref:4'-phosphopantetheinyl transferase family protein n=1 Tax=Escherichia coli TaxID=562 RepID=UPI0021572154
VELVSAKAEKVQHKFLTSEEQQMLQNIALFPWTLFDQKLLTAAWSIKEALYKWKGQREIDFRKHLVISSMEIIDNQGIAHCSIRKDLPVELAVQLLFFNENCISWVLRKV